jgi:glycerol-3-phosphate O-acyltransferase
LDDLLGRRDPEWRETTRDLERRPQWLNPLIDELGQTIMTHINASADVNPVNLLTMVLLGTPRHALGEKQLQRQIRLYQLLMTNRPTPERVTVTEKTPQEVVAYGFKMEILQRQEHALGDIVMVKPDRAIGLTYFRNNIAHLMALPSLVACCFLEHKEFRVSHIHRLGIIAHPFLKAELFIPWQRREIRHALDGSIEQLIEQGLLARCQDKQTVSRASDSPEAVMRLKILAHSQLQTLRRYLITISVLVRNGTGVLSRSELEQLCIDTAQRVSMLHEFNAPEFYDKAMFRQFIAQLRKVGYLSSDEDTRLVFDERLERISNDAKFILGEAIRQEIDRQTPRPKNGD